MSLPVLLWNVEWASNRSPEGPHLAGIFRELSPEVICLTEVCVDLVPNAGHLICCDGDHGYPVREERRKVVLWSSQSWSDVDAVGAPELPSGRFISGTSHGIRFVAVCIPWSAAHVSTGRRDRKPWEDHRAYLAGLKGVLERELARGIPLCLLGDFNQRIPKTGQPEDVFEQLIDTLGTRLRCETDANRAGIPLIDHLCVSDALSVSDLRILPRKTETGLELSDHDGVFARLQKTA